MTVFGIALVVLSMILLLGKEPARARAPLTRAVVARRVLALVVLTLGSLALARDLGTLEGLLVATTALCTAASLVPVLRATYPRTALTLTLTLFVLLLLGQYA